MSLYGLVYLSAVVLYLLCPLLPAVSARYGTLITRLPQVSCVGLGAILGGRLGYVLCYEPHWYSQHLGEIPQLWRGGMSFFGGVLGVCCAVFLSCGTLRRALSELDLIALLALLIIPLGRIVNFLNGELWGTPSTLPWAVIFEGADELPRHPVQLYEALTEGPLLALFIYLLYPRLKRRCGAVALCYLAGYAAFRLIMECWREPDAAVGYLPGQLSLGQYLCLTALLVCALLWRFLPEEIPGTKSGS
ncbi:MAG: prolipoprotein diacylglyceryl transferase [Succinivibrio sp.]|nr:prolipoprotein diacylglyceryl transferase [Succinivibrio sp.]